MKKIARNFYLRGLALSGAILAGGMLAASAGEVESPQFIRTASTSTPAFQTDFTNAAEKTVNAVVCIKSYTTRQQRGIRFLLRPAAASAPPAAEE